MTICTCSFESATQCDLHGTDALLRDEIWRLRRQRDRYGEALEHAAGYLAIIDTFKGQTAIAGIIRDVLAAGASPDGSPRARHEAFMRANAEWDRRVSEALEELGRIASDERFSNEYLGVLMRRALRVMRGDGTQS